MATCPWLRDFVEREEIDPLFTATGSELKKSIKDLMLLANRQYEIENELNSLLEISVEKGNDDTRGSVWIALILGEIQSRQAIFTLVKALASRDESLQEAAIDALTRIGEPAFDALMEYAEGTPDPDFDVAGMKTLSCARVWSHPYLLDEVKSFMLKKIQTPGLSQRPLEAAAMANAKLGNTKALTPLKAILKKRFNGMNGFIQDAIEMLEENPEEQPIQDRHPVWEERFELLTEDLLS